MSRYLKRTSLPITVVILLIAALFTFRGEAQQASKTGIKPATPGPLKPVVVRPVMTGISMAVRDMPAPKEVDISALPDFEKRVVNEFNSGGFNRGPARPVPSFDAAIAGKPSQMNGPHPSSVCLLYTSPSPRD